LTPLPKELDLFIAKLQQSTNYVIIELSLLFFTPRQFSIWRNYLHLGLLGWLAAAANKIVAIFMGVLQLKSELGPSNLN
jgi:hypothetical protein